MCSEWKKKKKKVFLVYLNHRVLYSEKVMLFTEAEVLLELPQKEPAGTFSSPVIGGLRCTWFKSSVNKPVSSSEIRSCSPCDGSAARPSRASAPGWTRSLCFAFRQPPTSIRKRPPVGLVWGQENGTSHLCVYALSSQGLMTSMREESIPSRAISESRQNRDTRCSRWVPDFCQRWRKSKAVITGLETDLMIFFNFILKP